MKGSKVVCEECCQLEGWPAEPHREVRKFLCPGHTRELNHQGRVVGRVFANGPEWGGKPQTYKDEDIAKAWACAEWQNDAGSASSGVQCARWGECSGSSDAKWGGSSGGKCGGSYGDEMHEKHSATANKVSMLVTKVGQLETNEKKLQETVAQLERDRVDKGEKIKTLQKKVRELENIGRVLEENTEWLLKKFEQMQEKVEKLENTEWLQEKVEKLEKLDKVLGGMHAKLEWFPQSVEKFEEVHETLAEKIGLVEKLQKNIGEIEKIEQLQEKVEKLDNLQINVEKLGAFLKAKLEKLEKLHENSEKLEGVA